MGMYTGVRFTASLTGFGFLVVKCLNEAHESLPRQGIREAIRKRPTHAWEAVAERFPGHFERWAKVGRCDFIPFGWVTLPDWPLCTSVLRIKTGTWTVVCSLKNYGHEIEQFLEEVLPILLAEPCDVTFHYEEDEEPVIISVEPRASDATRAMDPWATKVVTAPLRCSQQLQGELSCELAEGHQGHCLADGWCYGGTLPVKFAVCEAPELRLRQAILWPGTKLPRPLSPPEVPVSVSDANPLTDRVMGPVWTPTNGPESSPRCETPHCNEPRDHKDHCSGGSERAFSPAGGIGKTISFQDTDANDGFWVVSNGGAFRQLMPDAEGQKAILAILATPVSGTEPVERKLTLELDEIEANDLRSILEAAADDFAAGDDVDLAYFNVTPTAVGKLRASLTKAAKDVEDKA